MGFVWIPLCRKSAAGRIPANHPESGHEGDLLQEKRHRHRICHRQRYCHWHCEASGNKALILMTRWWKKLAMLCSCAKLREAPSRPSHGSRTRCPSTWRPTRGSAWWSKVNYEVRRRWKNLEDFTDRVRISFTFFLSRYFQCSCLV